MVIIKYKRSEVKFLSKPLDKDTVIQNKKEAIQSLNKLIESYINDPYLEHLKKANLISYWIKDYVRFINFEEKFDPTRNIAYKRGNIVKLNFGFNIGSEYGGLHYGVVLDKKNDHNSPVLTVIPLTSIKDGRDIHPNSIELGNEIYRSLKLKYDTISKALKDEKDEIEQTLTLFSVLVDLATESTDELQKCPPEDKFKSEYQEKLRSAQKYIDAAQDLQSLWKEKSEHNSKEQEYLDKIGDEISKMKEGSIALINQITTISKIRIFDPRNLNGVLSGISLSEKSMEQINQKVKELYVFP